MLSNNHGVANLLNGWEKNTVVDDSSAAVLCEAAASGDLNTVMVSVSCSV